MIIYYNFDGDICINLSSDITKKPDVILKVEDDIVTVIAGETSSEIKRGKLAIKEENKKLIVDFDADTEDVEGLEFTMAEGAADVESVIIKSEDGDIEVKPGEDPKPVEPEPGPGPEPEPDPEQEADDEAAAQGKKCKVNGEYLDSLKDAIASAQPGEAISIKMIADENGPGIGLFKADGQENLDITIDFNGHKYIATSPAVGSKGTQSQALHLEMNNKVTLKNGEFTADPAAADIKMLIQNYCDLTLENMVCDCSEDPTITYVCSNNFGNCLIKNSEIKAHPSRVAIDCWFGLGKTYDSGLTVTINDSKIDSTIEYGAQGAALKREGNENWFERAILTLEGSEFGSIINSGAGANDAHTIIIDGQKREQALPIVANVEG